MENVLKFRVAATLALTLLTVGTIFYHFNEGWTWIESVYFCVVSLATVGYGDFHPTNDVSRIFTVFYIFVGVGILVIFFNEASSMLVDRRVRRDEKRRQERVAKGQDKK